MKPYMPTFVLLLLVIAFGTIVTASAGALEDACHGVENSYVPVKFNTCMTLLSADPRSGSAKDLPAVAVISLDLAITKAISIHNKARELVDGNDKTLQRPSHICSSIYFLVESTLRLTSKAVASGRIEDAKGAVNSVFEAATACEEAFIRDDGKNISPIAGLNSEFGELGLLALDIVNNLQG